jgi:hypothetical protein
VVTDGGGEAAAYGAGEATDARHPWSVALALRSLRLPIFHPTGLRPCPCCHRCGRRHQLLRLWQRRRRPWSGSTSTSLCEENARRRRPRVNRGLDKETDET